MPYHHWRPSHLHQCVCLNAVHHSGCQGWILQEPCIHHHRTSPVLSNLFSRVTSMPEWVQTMTHGPLALVLLEWGKWMRMDSDCSNSVSFTTCASLTPSSRPSLNTRSPGDTCTQSTGTNWIWSWSGVPPSIMLFTHALTTVQTVTQTTPWYAVRSGCNQKSSIMQRNWGTSVLTSARWLSQILWNSLQRPLRRNMMHHSPEILPQRSGKLCETPSTTLPWLSLGRKPQSHMTGMRPSCLRWPLLLRQSMPHLESSSGHPPSGTYRLSGLPGARSNALPGAAPMSTGQSTVRWSRWLLQWATSEGCMMASRRHWDQCRARWSPSNLPLGKSSQTKASRWRDRWNTIPTSTPGRTLWLPQPWHNQVHANHGRAQCGANHGWAQQGHWHFGCRQGTRQWQYSSRPHQALQDHPTAPLAWSPLPVLEIGSCATRHGRCQDYYPVHEQGWEKWLQQLQGHLSSQRHWQSLHLGPPDLPAEAAWAHLPGITVWLPSWKVYGRHGLLPPSTPREVQRAADAPVHCIHQPHQGLRPCQQRWSLQGSL